ncbi:hypothetical protein [uncultured Sphingomonas sp.]|uniref:hypothetical protein n=1 Tax=uncultured Sphingomonas sp. TaxID=158754 RepID=UPI0035CAFF32
MAEAGSGTPSDLDSETKKGAETPSPTITSFVPPTKTLPDTMVRMWVSYALLLLLAVIVLAAFYALFQINGHPPQPNTDDNAADASRLMSLMNVVFGPIVTLFSSVVGFYFGARTAKEGAGS